MNSILSRTAFAFALASFATLWAPGARAQIATGGASGTTTLQRSDFTFYIEGYDPGQQAWVQLNATQQQYFFNRARCECAGDSNFAGSFKIAIVPSAGTAQKITALLAANSSALGAARLYAGASGMNCLDGGGGAGSDMPMYCLNLLDPSNYNEGVAGGMAVFESVRVWESPPIPVAWLFNSLREPVCNSVGSCYSAVSCATTMASTTIYFWAQTMSSPYPDRDDLMFVVNLSGNVPYAPTDATAEGENQALLVKWGWPVGVNPATDSSFLGLQLFCQSAQSNQVYRTGTYSPAFSTSAMMCPAAAPLIPTELPFSNLDPSYLCSGLLPASATSYRLTGLQNGFPYGVGVAAVDRYGNLSPISTADVVYASPGLPDAGSDNSTVLAENRGCSMVGWHTERGALPSLLALGLILAARGRRKR